VAKIVVGNLVATWEGLDPEEPGKVAVSLPLDPTPTEYLLDQEIRAVLEDPDGVYLAHGGAQPVPSRSWYALYSIVADFCATSDIPFEYFGAAPPPGAAGPEPEEVY